MPLILNKLKSGEKLVWKDVSTNNVKKSITVRTIFYNGETLDDFDYEDTTTLSFEEWLKQHNKKRIASGNCPEDKDDFVVYEAELLI